LHEAIRVSGLSNVGPLLPLMSGLDETQLAPLSRVVESLQSANLAR